MAKKYKPDKKLNSMLEFYPLPSDSFLINKLWNKARQVSFYRNWRYSLIEGYIRRGLLWTVSEYGPDVRNAKIRGARDNRRCMTCKHAACIYHAHSAQRLLHCDRFDETNVSPRDICDEYVVCDVDVSF